MVVANAGKEEDEAELFHGGWGGTRSVQGTLFKIELQNFYFFNLFTFLFVSRPTQSMGMFMEKSSFLFPNPFEVTH